MKRADSIMQRLQDFNQPNAFVVLSNAIDPLRPESRTDQRIQALEAQFDIIFWCLFDECPHDENSHCPQPAWRTQIVRQCLKRPEIHAKLVELLERDKLLVMGFEAYWTVDAFTMLPLLQLRHKIPHAETWSREENELEVHAALLRHLSSSLSSSFMIM